MEGTVTIVCSRESSLGFRLAGIEAIAVETSAQSERALSELMERGEAGLVLVAHKVWDQVSPRLREDLDASTRPFFVDVPVAAPGPEEDEDDERARSYVGSVIQQAVGQRIRIA